MIDEPQAQKLNIGDFAVKWYIITDLNFPA
jgi:hypothetical protein